MSRRFLLDTNILSDLVLRPQGVVAGAIGPNDLLIAAQALADNCTLVTANEREFARVPCLKVENWLAH